MYMSQGVGTPSAVLLDRHSVFANKSNGSQEDKYKAYYASGADIGVGGEGVNGSSIGETILGGQGTRGGLQQSYAQHLHCETIFTCIEPTWGDIERCRGGADGHVEVVKRALWVGLSQKGSERTLVVARRGAVCVFGHAGQRWLTAGRGWPGTLVGTGMATSRVWLHDASDPAAWSVHATSAAPAPASRAVRARSSATSDRPTPGLSAAFSAV